MALTLTLDVVARGVLAWNQSNVVVPSELAGVVSAFDVGAVVEAQCTYLPAGLTVKSLGAVKQPSGDLDTQLLAAVERENWRGVLSRLEGRELTARQLAFRALAQRRMGDLPGFSNSFSTLVSMDGVELTSGRTGLWSLRCEFPDDVWSVVDRSVRAQTWKLLWQGVLRSSEATFRSQPFADTLWKPFDRLLEAVSPEARPHRVMAGGPRVDYSFEGTEVLARGAMLFRGLAASEAEWRELEPACAAIAHWGPEERPELVRYRDRPRVTSLNTVVTHLINAIRNKQPRAAFERTIGALASLLASREPDVAREYLEGLDSLAMCIEVAELVPKSHAALKENITAVHYRGSLALKRDELDAVLGEAGGRWFALRRHDREWLCIEGSREDVLATMPDALFEEAVVKLLGVTGT